MTENNPKLMRGDCVPKNGKKLCSVCREHKPLDSFLKMKSTRGVLYGHLDQVYFGYCKLCTRWRQRSKNLLSKLEFILEYGGKCQCCGEIEIDFLTVEHIGGSASTADTCFGGSLIANLKVRRWPKDKYTVLCFNCNCCKKFGRPCPHNVKDYERYMEMLFSYMSGEHKDRYNRLMTRLNEAK